MNKNKTKYVLLNTQNINHSWQCLRLSRKLNVLCMFFRYFAIFYPQKNIIKPEYASIVIVVIWLVPALVQTPWAIYYSYAHYPNPAYDVRVRVCYPNFATVAIERGYFLGMFLMCYLIPLSFILICYSLIGIKVWRRSVTGIRGSRTERNIQKSKVRILRMLVMVAVVFTLSWLPLYSIRMRILFGTPPDESERSILKIIAPIAQWLGAANSCVNPFIYCYFSLQFRRGIIALLKSRSCCDKITVQSTTVSTAGMSAAY